MTHPASRRSDYERIAALLKQRKPAQAEAACRLILSETPRDAAAIHFLGLARKDAGDFVEGERLIRESIAIEPRNGDFHANLANLLRRLNRLPDAEQCYREALALIPGNRPARAGLARTLLDLGQHGAAETQCRELVSSDRNDPEGWNVLAMALRGQNRLAESEAAYRHAIELNPGYGTAHHNLGSLLSQMERAEEALQTLERAQQLGVGGFELAFNRGRTLMQLYRPAEAEQAFAAAVALNPTHADAQLNLAGLRYMRGDPDYSRDIAAAAATSRSPAAQMLFSTVLWRAGDLTGAERVLRNLIASHGPDPDARCMLSQVLHEQGRLKEAETEATEAAIAKPGDPDTVETFVTILLSRGRPDDALPFIAAQHSRFPTDQRWIAFDAVAARLLGLPRYRELHDYARLVRTYDLEAPRGWSSMEDLNSALLGALDSRHLFSTHPLNQSLRNGSQTARSLLTDADPAIKAILTAFAAPIEDYRRAIGAHPDHPLTQRNSGTAQIVGAWSVQLRRNGFHVNHIHPRGWISSAYYVAVPDEVEDVSAMSGWLKFGETRLPVPGATPETFVAPRPGRLVLFPSYMWHGTTPIHGTQTRTTIAFDVVPVQLQR
jgi:Flp pilus assembly protein TadD